MGRFGFAVLLALAGAAAPAAEPGPWDGPAVDRLVRESLEKWGTPGVAVVVVRDGTTVHLKGYGARRQGADEPVTADTLFPLASCTKAFTTTLLAMLVDDGKLRWDDPVRKHLPDFHLSDPHADALLTVRDLATHRTGLAGHDLLWYRAPWGIDEVLLRTARLPLEGQFRGSYHYSSIPFMAAGRVAARAGGAPWERQVRDRICAPLGMTAVAFTRAEAERSADRAFGHRRSATGSVEPMPAYDLAEPNPAGSLHASARDLAPWLAFQLAGGEWRGKRLVSRANLAETKSPQTVMPRDATIAAIYPDSHQVSYGMGWVVYDHRGRPVVAHGGIIDGFRAQVTLLPEARVGFALLNNLHETKMNIALGNKLIDHVLGLPRKDWDAVFLKVEADERRAKREKIERRNRERRPGTRPSVPLTRFAGEYEHPAYGVGTVEHRDGGLVWTWSSFTSPLEHFQDDTFRVTKGYFEDELVEFAGEKGMPTKLRTMGGLVFVRK